MMATSLAAAWIFIPWLACLLFLVHFASPPLGVLEIWFMSVPVSFALSSVLIFVVSSYMGVLDQLAIQISLSLFTVILLYSIYPAIKTFRSRKLLWKGEIMTSKRFLFLMGLVSICLFAVIYRENFHQSATGEWIVTNAASEYLYLRRSLVNSFVKGSSGENLQLGILPRSPIFPEERMYYSFFPEFYEASLVKSGVNEMAAMWIPSTLLSVSLVGLTMCFSLRILEYHFYKALGCSLLSLCSGGTGFFIFYLGFNLNPKVLMAYNFIESYSESSKNHIFWKSLLSQTILDNYSALFGFPIVLSVFILFYVSYRKNASVSSVVRCMFLAGLFSSTLPMLHRESFIGIIITSVCLILANPTELYDLRRFSGWFVFSFPIILFAVPFELHYVIRAVLAPPLDFDPKIPHVPSYIAIKPLWFFDRSLRKHIQAGGILTKAAGAIMFWLRTLWLFVPLFIFGCRRALKMTYEHRTFCLASAFMFIICNFVSFSPFRSNMIELLQIWVILASFVVIIALQHIGRSKSTMIIISVFVISTLVASNGLAIAHRLMSPTSVAYDSEAFEVASWIEESTPRSAVFLSSPSTRNVANVLAGRNVRVGPKSWLSQLGHYNTTTQDIYNTGKIFSQGISRQYRRTLRTTDYILIDPATADSLHFYSSFWENPPGAAKKLQTPSYTIFQLDKNSRQIRDPFRMK